MGKIGRLRRLGLVTRRPVSVENARPEAVASRSRADANPRTADAGYAVPVTDAQKLLADGLHQPTSVVGLTNRDTGRSTMGERIRADGLNNPASRRPEYAAPATDAQKLLADGLHQPTSVAGLTSRDTGRSTMGERIRADGLN